MVGFSSTGGLSGGALDLTHNQQWGTLDPTGYASSDAAGKWQQRFAKSRQELFEFLRHDGVPWNNNNAERAVKGFAQYRAISEGVMTERCLNDYLVLLSIEQTCRYREVSFLRFLLSGEKDLDRYGERGRETRRHSPR